MIKTHTLIGLPMVGKTNMGERLAKKTQKNFYDGDYDLLYTIYGFRNHLDFFDCCWVLAKQRGCSVDTFYVEEEERMILKAIDRGYLNNAVFAPGGSICYEPKAIEVLKEAGPVMYLERDPKEIMERIQKRYGKKADATTVLMQRGVVNPNKKSSLEELLEERIALYKEQASLTIPLHNCRTPEETIEKIMSTLRETKLN